MTAADLRIGRVVLRGTASAVEHARATLPAALARAHWPADEAIVVVRRVAVGGTATELPARAAAAAEHLTRRAADPWSPAADSAEAVRFRDALDYRACLVRDLLAGTAAHRWLWRHRAALLARPKTQALADLLAEDALALPALLDRPALRDSLPALWRTLDAPAAREVLRAIGAATGWQSAIARALDPTTHGRRADEPKALSAAWIGVIDADAGIPPSDIRRKALRFSALQSELPNDLPPSDPRVVLQAVLALWTQTPATLAAASAGEALRAVAESFARAAPSAEPTTNEPRQPQTPTADATRKTGETAPAPTQAGPTETPVPATNTSRQATPPAANAAPLDTPTGDTPHNARPRAPSTPSRVSSTAASPAVLPPAADVDFHTRGGGFFFLLNVLNLPALRDWRATLSAPEPGTVRAEPVEAPATALRQAQGERGCSIAGSLAEPQAGWRELVRLARWLDFAPDAPLAAFLADACALDASDDPAAALAALPPGADLAPVCHAALRHYGEAALAAALGERPARVRATRSHLDVHLRLADVQLDIRRTGLDLDPGWLPWLGRVVRFHYDSGGFPS